MCTDRLRQTHTQRIRSGSQTLIWVLWSASPAMETICADGLKLVTKASNVFPSWNKQHVLSVEVSLHAFPQLKQTACSQCWGLSPRTSPAETKIMYSVLRFLTHTSPAETNSMYSVLWSLTTHFPSWNKQHVLSAEVSHHTLPQLQTACIRCWGLSPHTSPAEINSMYYMLRSLTMHISTAETNSMYSVLMPLTTHFPSWNKQHVRSAEVSHHALPQLELQSFWLSFKSTGTYLSSDSLSFTWALDARRRTFCSLATLPAKTLLQASWCSFKSTSVYSGSDSLCFTWE